MSVFTRHCQRQACKDKKTCKHRHYHYDFWINGTRYRGSIKEARTRDQAEQAEVRLRNEVFEGTYGARKRIVPLFEEFVNDTYLPWAKTNRRSWKSDELRCKALVKHFGAKRLDEITPEMIEAFKTIRRDSIARRGNRLTQASVNRELEVLSKIYSKALDFDKAERNPCRRLSASPCGRLVAGTSPTRRRRG